MNRMLLLRVALVLCTLLLVAAACLIVLQRSKRRARAYGDRVAAVVPQPVSFNATQANRRGLVTTEETKRSGPYVWLLRRLTRSPRRRPDELVKLWIVVIVGLVLSTILARFLTGLVGNLAWITVVILPVVMSRALFGWRDRRLADAYRRQFPEALAIIVRTVRVGVPVAEALRLVARESEDPTAAEFTYLVNRIAIGVPLGDALHNTAERTGLTEHRLFATAVALQSQTGGGLTDTLSGLASTVRKRIMARDRAHALASEARTTAYILGGLPVVTGGILAFANPGYVAILFTDHGGNMILALACTSLLIGFSAMRLIIQKSLT